jgi:hypothetical protein
MLKELLSSDAREYGSDAREYGGSGSGNMGGTEALEEKTHSRPYSLPLGALFLRKA